MKISTKYVFSYSALSLSFILLLGLLVSMQHVRSTKKHTATTLEYQIKLASDIFSSTNDTCLSVFKKTDTNLNLLFGYASLTIYKNGYILYESTNIKEQNSQQTTLNSCLFYDNCEKNQYSFFAHNAQYLIKTIVYDTKNISQLYLFIYVLLCAFVGFICLLVGLWLISRNWYSKPLLQIIAEVEAINPTILKRRLTTKRNDEIAQLSSVFNRLLDKIASAFETEKMFIANASHELRTPVTSIMGQIEVCLDEKKSIEEYEELLQSVYDDAAQIATIINGFLDLAAANLSPSRINMLEIDVVDSIFEVIEAFEKRKPNYVISVEYENVSYEPNQYVSWGNQGLIFLLFSNVIDNACKYSNNKKARIYLRTTTDQIFVIVADNGIGIPKSEIDQIFNPLQRGSNVNDRPGHGIGLAIVKRIATIHNITIDITSEIQVGTCVSIAFKK